MNRHHPFLITAGLSALLLTGCAGADGTGQPASQLPLGASQSAAPDEHSGHTPEAGQQSTGSPSAASLMVCGDEPKERLVSILSLAQPPHSIQSWENHTFTCTYHLEQGPLLITVQEAADQPAALKAFETAKAAAVDATPLEGLANLGFPAYETPAGAAAFQKDSMVLTVDASQLPATMGPNGITRNALAYQLASTILACWVEHH